MKEYWIGWWFMVVFFDHSPIPLLRTSKVGVEPFNHWIEDLGLRLKTKTYPHNDPCVMNRWFPQLLVLLLFDLEAKQVPYLVKSGEFYGKKMVTSSLFSMSKIPIPGLWSSWTFPPTTSAAEHWCRPWATWRSCSACGPRKIGSARGVYPAADEVWRISGGFVEDFCGHFWDFWLFFSEIFGW